MLNSMQQLLTGDASYFDPLFIQDLLTCWDNTNPDLRQAQDAAWQGMIDYFEMDGFGNQMIHGAVGMITNLGLKTMQQHKTMVS